MASAVARPSLTFGLESLNQVAKTLIEEAGDLRIWTFYGDLGSGKTTLIKEVCTVLGVEPELMSSPTFSIVNEYESSGSPIYHFDFYRLKNEVEVMDLGIDEYFDSGCYCFVEWPDRLGALFPTQYFKVSIKHLEDTKRQIEFEKYG